MTAAITPARALELGHRWGVQLPSDGAELRERGRALVVSRVALATHRDEIAAAVYLVDPCGGWPLAEDLFEARLRNAINSLCDAMEQEWPGEAERRLQAARKIGH